MRFRSLKEHPYASLGVLFVLTTLWKTLQNKNMKGIDTLNHARYNRGIKKGKKYMNQDMWNMKHAVCKVGGPQYGVYKSYDEAMAVMQTLKGQYPEDSFYLMPIMNN